MREVAGLSYEELGLLLGVTRPGVESLLFRARGRLRNRLSAALASLNLAGLVSEGMAAVARLVGSSAAPLAVKAAAVGVGVAVVGGGGVVAEQSSTRSRRLRHAYRQQPGVRSHGVAPVRNERDLTPQFAVVHDIPVVSRAIVRGDRERTDDLLRASGDDRGHHGLGRAASRPSAAT